LFLGLPQVRVCFLVYLRCAFVSWSTSGARLFLGLPQVRVCFLVRCAFVSWSTSGVLLFLGLPQVCVCFLVYLRCEFVWYLLCLLLDVFVWSSFKPDDSKTAELKQVYVTEVFRSSSSSGGSSSSSSSRRKRKKRRRRRIQDR